MRASRRALLFAVCGILALRPCTALAGPPSDFVKSYQTSACVLLEAAKPDQKRIVALFDKMIDYGAIARASLGTDWGTLTGEQQVEFIALLRQLVIRAYQNQLTKTAAYRFEYPGESKGEGSWIVRTRAIHKTDKRAEPISIDFRLEEDGNASFHVIDIVVEDVSLTESYRAQFVKLLKKAGYPGLIARMKEKIDAG